MLSPGPRVIIKHLWVPAFFLNWRHLRRWNVTGAFERTNQSARRPGNLIYANEPLWCWQWHECFLQAGFQVEFVHTCSFGRPNKHFPRSSIAAHRELSCGNHHVTSFFVNWMSSCEETQTRLSSLCELLIVYSPSLLRENKIFMFAFKKGRHLYSFMLKGKASLFI